MTSPDLPRLREALAEVEDRVPPGWVPYNAEVTVRAAARAWADLLENGGPIPAGMTPDKLRYVAKSLDILAQITALALPLLRVDGATVPADDLEALREWTEGVEQQDDLRRWADDLERVRLVPDPEEEK